MKADGEDLLDAVRERKRGVAKSLIQSRANLNYTNSFGWTSLHWAADRGLLEVTNMLLDFNADVNARDLNEATPIIAAARANCLGTARALMARGARLDLLDEWEDSALNIAVSTGHTKMAAQLRSASKGPLDRLAGAKVVFSYPPSLYPQLERLVSEVRKVPGGQGIYGVGDDPRMAVDMVKDENPDPEEDGGGDGGSPTASPTKVTWSGPEVPWCQACARVAIAVQVAPDSQEYIQHEACREQSRLLQMRRQLDGVRHRLKEDALLVLPVKEEDAPQSPFWEEVERLSEEVRALDKMGERLRHRLRHFDDRVFADRAYLSRLTNEPTAKSLQEDRMEEMDAFIAEAAKLEESVAPLLERVHEVLKQSRHARLEQEIEMIDDAVTKLKSRLLPLPKEPARDASSKEQDTYKADHARIKADNEKLNSEIAKREKQMSTLKDKLKGDLKTLEKPHPAPNFLVTISERHFKRLDAAGLTLWLNWQCEANGGGGGGGAKAAKKKAAAASNK
jgi:hypothetical protein